MKLTALMPVRNEDWVLGFSARAALLWCDALVILDHASEDGTAAIIEDLLAEYPGRVVKLRNDDPIWHEMEHRQTMLETARAHGATHVAIVDADEIVTGNLLSILRPIIEGLSPGWMLELPGYNVRGDLCRYHANGIWGNRWFTVAFADDARLHWAGDRFHHREPMGLALNSIRPVGQGTGGVMHLWGLNERRLVAKHALYKMTEVLRWPGKSRAEIDRVYSQAFDPRMNGQFDQTWRFAVAPNQWWDAYRELLSHLYAERWPWQERYCLNLYALYGAARFSGLNLFDVCTRELQAL